MSLNVLLGFLILLFCVSVCRLGYFFLRFGMADGVTPGNYRWVWFNLFLSLGLTILSAVGLVLLFVL